MSTQFGSAKTWDCDDGLWSAQVSIAYDYERLTTGMRWRFYVTLTKTSGTMTIPINLKISINESAEITSYLYEPDFDGVIKAHGTDLTTLTYDTGWLSKTGEFAMDSVYCYIGLETPLDGIRGSELQQWALPLYFTGDVNCYNSKSQITIYGYPTIGQTHNFVVTGAYSGYTHKVIFELNQYSQTVTLASGSTVTSGSWVPNVAGFAAQSPDSNRPRIEITLETYLNNVKIGTVETWTYLNVTGIPPSTIIGVTDVSQHLATYGYYLLGYSEIGVALVSTAQYGATIDSEIVYVGSEQITPPDNVVLPSVFNGTIQAVVTDSRTANGSSSVNITTRAYAPPNVKNDSDNIALFSVHRVDGNGNADDTGEYCRVDFTVVYDLLNATGSAVGRNSHRLWVEWESNSGSISGSAEITVTSYEFTGSYTFAADIEHSFTVSLRMQDDIRDASNPVIRSTQLSTAQVILDWLVGGHGVGIGKVSENYDALDINPDWDVNLGDISHLKFNGVALTFPGDTVIKEGDTGIWHYRFWESGIVELFGTQSFNITTATQVCGWYLKSLYYMENNNQAFPVWQYDQVVDGDATESYIVGTTQSSTRQDSDWLSLTDGGAALTPVTGELYIIKTQGTYYDAVWTWDGHYYIPYTRNTFVEMPVCIAQVFGNNSTSQGTEIMTCLFPKGAPSYINTFNFSIGTSQAVTALDVNVSFYVVGKYKT